MARYTIKNPDGRSMTVSGDHPPSQKEAAQLWASVDVPVGATAALKGTEGISETPWYQRGIQFGYGPDVTLPSPERLTELLPGLEGSAGALIGGLNPAAPVSAPILAAIGAASGEAHRQLIRRLLFGAPQAPGYIQGARGLDPNSTEAAASGILGEVGMSLALEVPARIFGAVASGVPRQAQKSAAKALGFTKSTADEAARHTPFLLEGAPVGSTLSSRPARVFRPFRSNTPEAILPRIQKIADEASLRKEAILASPIGDIPIPPSEVRAQIASEVERLTPDVGLVGPRSEPFPGAMPAIETRREALNTFDRLQAAAAEHQGHTIPVTSQVSTGPLTAPRTVVTHVPDPNYLNARTADELRGQAMNAYRAPKTLLDSSRGLGDQRVGLELTDQLNKIPLIEPSNTAQFHSLGALTPLKRVVQENLVAGGGGVAPQAAARSVGGNVAGGATLEAVYSGMRNLGVSGQNAALLKLLGDLSVQNRNPATNYAALQALVRLIEDLRVQQSRPAQPSPGE